jgi:hypothetical protein
LLRLELDPVAELERRLHLQREAAHEVAERVLEGETDDGREERGGREERAWLDADRPQREQEDDDVDDRLREVAEDTRRRSMRPPAEDDVNGEEDKAAPA